MALDASNGVAIISMRRRSIVKRTGPDENSSVRANPDTAIATVMTSGTGLSPGTTGSMPDHVAIDQTISSAARFAVAKSPMRRSSSIRLFRTSMATSSPSMSALVTHPRVRLTLPASKRASERYSAGIPARVAPRHLNFPDHSVSLLVETVDDLAEGGRAMSAETNPEAAGLLGYLPYLARCDHIPPVCVH